MKSIPHVLLIEPDKILAAQIESFLSSKGYQATVAHNAQEAILAADKVAPDAVVLEVLLSNHSGIEFLYEFRSYHEWTQIPVIILSRVSQSELHVSTKTMRDLGIEAVLYKPSARLGKLGDLLDALLAQTAGTR